eukprot:TRINITY_DN18209_c0_g1_i1.p1 TRINITY_DN18209_c0_g1~~TRINITY_DN18209_c0_g1_i1.p1  ORF type:complete len:593 (-),score=132.31 TRINITY_DN18209_c0_g1_i1:2-1780(-)
MPPLERTTGLLGEAKMHTTACVEELRLETEGLFGGLLARHEALRAEHELLRNCLLSAGLVFPEELQQQRSGGAAPQACPLLALCRRPAAVQLIADAAGIDGMAHFAAASSVMLSASRSMLMLGLSRRLEKRRSASSSMLPAGDSTAGDLETCESQPAEDSCEAGNSEAQTGEATESGQSDPQSSSAEAPLAEPPISPQVVGAAVGGLEAAPRGWLHYLPWRSSVALETLPLGPLVVDCGEAVRGIARFAGFVSARQLSEVSRSTSEALQGKATVLKELRATLPSVYVCGDVSGQVGDSVAHVEVATGAWEALPPTLVQRSTCSLAASLQGRVFVLGGTDDPLLSCVQRQQQAGESEEREAATQDLSRQPEMYDPVLKRWELLPELPKKFTHAAAAVAGERLYVFGGLSSGCVLDQAQRYDPLAATCKWEALPPLPTPRFECCAAATGGKLFVLGGANLHGEALAVVEKFDPVVGSWSAVANMGQPRYGGAAAVAAGKVLAFGGHGLWPSVSDVELLDPVYGTWAFLPPMPAPRSRCGAAAVGRNVVLIFGGNCADQDALTIDRLSVDTCEWEHCVYKVDVSLTRCSAVAAPS